MRPSERWQSGGLPSAERQRPSALCVTAAPRTPLPGPLLSGPAPLPKLLFPDGAPHPEKCFSPAPHSLEASAQRGAIRTLGVTCLPPGIKCISRGFLDSPLQDSSGETLKAPPHPAPIPIHGGPFTGAFSGEELARPPAPPILSWTLPLLLAPVFTSSWCPPQASPPSSPPPLSLHHPQAWRFPLQKATATSCSLTHCGLFRRA